MCPSRIFRHRIFRCRRRGYWLTEWSLANWNYLAGIVAVVGVAVGLSLATNELFGRTGLRSLVLSAQAYGSRSADYRGLSAAVLSPDGEDWLRLEDHRVGVCPGHRTLLWTTGACVGNNPSAKAGVGLMDGTHDGPAQTWWTPAPTDKPPEQVLRQHFYVVVEQPRGPVCDALMAFEAPDLVERIVWPGGDTPGRGGSYFARTSQDDVTVSDPDWTVFSGLGCDDDPAFIVLVMR